MAIDPIGLGGVTSGAGSVPYEGPWQLVYSTTGQQGTFDLPATADYRFSVIGKGGQGSWAAGSGQGATGVDSDWKTMDKGTTMSYNVAPNAPSTPANNNADLTGGGITMDAGGTINGITATRNGQMGGHGASYYATGQPGVGRYGGKGGNARTQAGQA